MTTIEINGIRIEHDGGDNISIHAEAPSTIGIQELIGELVSLQAQTLGATGTCFHFLQSQHNRIEELSHRVATE
tara:strand:+ start:1203 stop:1424 length:222 start_codon:yes stop_codon:yes gene_type:complete